MGQQGSNPIPQQGNATTNASIQPYYVGPGQAGNNYASMGADEYGRVKDWGNQNAPTFEGMFSKYVDVANRTANEQAGKIGETMGSRGALYSSANLQEQANLRQKTTQDIGLQSQTFLKDIEDQRQKAEMVRQSGFAGAAGIGKDVAQAELGSREAAMARAWQDFVRQSDVPPFASGGMQWGSGVPRGATYAT